MYTIHSKSVETSFIFQILKQFHSFANKPFACSINLNTVTVAFQFEIKTTYDKSDDSEKSSYNYKRLEGLGKLGADEGKLENVPMTEPGVARPNANLHPDYATCACVVEDTRSVHSSSDGFSDKMLATNILSRMAKTKASWVENQKSPENSPNLQRKSPILCKGKPFGHASLTPYMLENKLFSDRRTKGVRDGKKLDLLPISKYLARGREEEKWHRNQSVPLVLISSYHAVYGGDEKEFREQNHEQKEKMTFFTTKDLFKPLHARSLPTRGEALYIAPSQGKLNTKYDVKLPRINKSLNNAFDTEMNKPSKTRHSRFHYKANVALPVIVN